PNSVIVDTRGKANLDCGICTMGPKSCSAAEGGVPVYLGHPGFASTVAACGRGRSTMTAVTQDLHTSLVTTLGHEARIIRHAALAYTRARDRAGLEAVQSALRS